MEKQGLKEKYKEIAKILKEEFGIKNQMALPRILKVVVNIGIGEFGKDQEARKRLMEDVAAITGQKPALRSAKISVAGFNVREGMPVGVTATLRGTKMYDFLEKLFSIVLPRLRDFRGVKLASFDKGGNYTLGLEEYTVFPEVDLSKLVKPKGIEITIVTGASDPEKSKRLLTLLGMPFEKES